MCPPQLACISHLRLCDNFKATKMTLCFVHVVISIKQKKVKCFVKIIIIYYLIILLFYSVLFFIFFFQMEKKINYEKIFLHGYFLVVLQEYYQRKY